MANNCRDSRALSAPQNEEREKTAPSTQVLTVKIYSVGDSSEDIVDLSNQSSFRKAIRIVAYAEGPKVQLPLCNTEEESPEALLMILLRQEQRKYYDEESRTRKEN